MDRTWIKKGVIRLSSEHIKGVEEFMHFVCQSIGNDARCGDPAYHCML
jgi:hypothetical protein